MTCEPFDKMTDKEKVEHIAQANGVSPATVAYELRGGDAMTAGLIVKVLGLVSMAIGPLFTMMIVNPHGTAIAWTFAAWGMFFFISTVLVVRWGKSRLLWGIWFVIVALFAASIVLLFQIQL